MNELSLFSGAGGGLLGSKLLGWRCIGYVEWEEYCQKVLAQRIKDGFLDRAPIFGDIRAFNTHWAERYRGLVDVITAGFPCQPFSTAGKRQGADDERNMWPATLDCIRLVRPRYCLLENVPGLVASGYIGTILGDLAQSGYNARRRPLSAAEVGAPHRRDRLWIVADSKQCTDRCQVLGQETVGQNASGPASRPCGSSGALAESDRAGCNAGRHRQARDEGQTRGTVGTLGERGLDKRPRMAGKQGLADTASQGTEPAEQREQEHGSKPSGEIPDSNSAGLAKREGKRENNGQEQSAIERSDCQWWKTDPADLPNAASGGLNQGAGLCEEKQAEQRRGRSTGNGAWSVESRVGRVVDGCPHRVDRLKALGNMQVPKVEATAWNLLTQEEG